MLPDQGQVQQVLSLSSDRDLWEKLADQAFRAGFFSAWQAGFDKGYARRVTDEARAWHEIIHPMAHPDAFADARVRNAEAAARRDAAEHERSFVARAYATPRPYRTAIQQTTTVSYPPPARGP